MRRGVITSLLPLAIMPVACKVSVAALDGRPLVITPPPADGATGSGPATPGPEDVSEIPQPTIAPGRTPPPTPEPFPGANLWLEVQVNGEPEGPELRPRDTQNLLDRDPSIAWELEAPGPWPDKRTGTLRPEQTTGLARTLVESLFSGTATASFILMTGTTPLESVIATASVRSARNNILRLALHPSGMLAVDLSAPLPWPTPFIRMTVQP